MVCYLFNTSVLSMPAFSASWRGMISKARAKEFTISCCLPWMVLVCMYVCMYVCMSSVYVCMAAADSRTLSTSWARRIAPSRWLRPPPPQSGPLRRALRSSTRRAQNDPSPPETARRLLCTYTYTSIFNITSSKWHTFSYTRLIYVCMYVLCTRMEELQHMVSMYVYSINVYIHTYVHTYIHRVGTSVWWWRSLPWGSRWRSWTSHLPAPSPRSYRTYPAHFQLGHTYIHCMTWYYIRVLRGLSYPGRRPMSVWRLR